MTLPLNHPLWNTLHVVVVTLTVTGKVTSMSEEEWGEDKEIHTSLTLRLSKIQRIGSSADSEDDAEA